MGKESIETRTEKLLGPILAQNNFELVDVEYVKEGSDYFLRAFIDKANGINIDDCELVSRALEAKLDEEDFISEAYILEVSSPGLTRPLKKVRDFERNLGKPVEIHLFKPVDKQKVFIGDLDLYDDNSVTIVTENEKKTFDRKDISIIRQYFDFNGGI